MTGDTARQKVPSKGPQHCLIPGPLPTSALLDVGKLRVYSNECKNIYIYIRIAGGRFTTCRTLWEHLTTTHQTQRQTKLNLTFKLMFTESLERQTAHMKI